MSVEESGQVQEQQKKKRRSSAEVQAEREAIARAKQAAEDANSALPPAVERMSPIDAMATLASNNINPSEYSDLYGLMKDCIRFKREYNLSDNKFMELMDRFDDRVVDENNDKPRRRR